MAETLANQVWRGPRDPVLLSRERGTARESEPGLVISTLLGPEGTSVS